MGLQADDVDGCVNRRVTLTFDNGPTRGVTPGVIDALARNGNPRDLLRDRRQAGGSGRPDAHARRPRRRSLDRQSHADAFGPARRAERCAAAVREIEETQARIGAYAHPDKLFRPYGRSGRIGPHLLSRAALSLLLARRYCCVIWNSVPGDWCDPHGWVERCVDDVKTRDWTVVVLHDMSDACLPRLRELLARLDDVGVEYRQDFPDNVVLTRAGREVSMSASYLTDA